MIIPLEHLEYSVVGDPSGTTYRARIVLQSSFRISSSSTRQPTNDEAKHELRQHIIAELYRDIEEAVLKLQHLTKELCRAEYVHGATRRDNVEGLLEAEKKHRKQLELVLAMLRGE